MSIKLGAHLNQKMSRKDKINKNQIIKRKTEMNLQKWQAGHQKVGGSLLIIDNN